MTPDQSWLSVLANRVPGELLFLLIPPRFGLLTAAACMFRPVHREVSFYLSDTWTPCSSSLLPVLMVVCSDAESKEAGSVYIDWINSCIWWGNSRKIISHLSGVHWDRVMGKERIRSQRAKWQNIILKSQGNFFFSCRVKNTYFFLCMWVWSVRWIFESAGELWERLVVFEWLQSAR